MIGKCSSGRNREPPSAESGLRLVNKRLGCFELTRSWLPAAVVCSLFFVGILVAFSMAPANQDSEPEKGCRDSGNVKFKVPTVAELPQLPASKPPIATAAEAVAFALRQDSVSEDLLWVESKGMAKAWIVDVRTRTDDECLWRVKFKSAGLIPSFSCVVSFTPTGSVTPAGWPDNFCGYNK